MNWDDQREAFGNTAVIDTISEYAPNLKNIILNKQVLTPLDLEREFVKRRQYFQEANFHWNNSSSSSGAGLRAVSHAHQEPLHVRLGHASRRRHYGRARTLAALEILKDGAT